MSKRFLKVVDFFIYSIFPSFFDNIGAERGAGEWYTQRMKDRDLFLPSKVGQVLLAVSRGRDMTKLDIKNATELSMSTVLSAVETLRKRELLTVGTRTVVTGGKPHSVINVAENVAVYGVSYKARGLTAVSIDLRGLGIASAFLEVSEPADPLIAVEKVLSDLRQRSPKPIALTLAMNGTKVEEVASILGEKYGIPCFLTTNTAVTAYRALWEYGEAPICVIGVGNRVKCAYLSEGCRLIDVGALPCPVMGTREGSRYEDVLSVGKVRERLGAKDFRDVYAALQDRRRVCANGTEYITWLSRSVAALADTTALYLAPRRTYLFGEYVTQDLFEKIRAESTLADTLRQAPAERSDFAYGAALHALLQGVLNG